MEVVLKGTLRNVINKNNDRPDSVPMQITGASGGRE